MMWAWLSFGVLFMTQDLGASEFQERSIRLSQLAQEEVSLIARLQSLRKATEGLPSDWRAPSFNDPKVEIDRDDLMKELTRMEFSAAGRWNVIVNNLAQLRETEETSEVRHWRQQLVTLEEHHQAMNRRLDAYNSRLKDGILMNLAQQIEMSATTSED